MKQKIITQFFCHKENQLSFVLDWRIKDKPKCYWADLIDLSVDELNQSKDFYKYSKDVKYNKNIIKLYGIFSKKFVFNSLKNDKDKQQIAFTKSLLQKSVRRGLDSIALKSTKELFSNLQILIRRLSIIMIEDVALFNEFSILAWLTAVDKSFKYQTYILQWLLGLVSNLCKHPTKIQYDRNNDDQIDIKPNNSDLVNSLLFRKMYGGLQGDIRLINNIIGDIQFNASRDNYNYGYNKIVVLQGETIVNRLNNIIGDIRIENFNEPIQLIKTIDINDLTLDDWYSCLSAIDFHVCNIAKTVSEKTGIKENEVRLMIWSFRSSVNFRSISVRNYENDSNYIIWKKIKKLVTKISKEILVIKLLS